MAITMKGRNITFTGKDRKEIESICKELNISVKDFVVGSLWELFMKKAIAGVFKRKAGNICHI